MKKDPLLLLPAYELNNALDILKGLKNQRKILELAEQIYQSWESLPETTTNPNNSTRSIVDPSRIEWLKAIITFRGITKEKEQLTNQKEKKTDETKKIRYTSFMESNEMIYEQIYNTNTKTSNFIRYDGEETIIVDSFEKGETLYLPQKGQSLETQAVILPEDVGNYENTEELIKELKTFIHKYVDVTEQYETFCAWYILLSWVYDRLNTINYLRVLGDTGLGKTRFLDTVGRITYKPMILSGIATPALVFRMINKWKGTLVIDEADWDNSEEKNDIIKILNCGFQKGTPVGRCDKDNPDDEQFFEVYGPKVLSTRRLFTDQATESRCLTHKVYGTKRKDIPDSLGNKFYEEQKELRKKLLRFRLNNYFKINSEDILNIDLGCVESRLRQATRGFASMFSYDSKAMEDFKAFLIKYNAEIIEERSDSFDGGIVNSIVNLVVDGELIINSHMILNKMIDEGYLKEKSKTTPATIGKHLKSLNISVVPKKVDGKTMRCIIIDDEFINVVRRYVSDAEKIQNVVTAVTVVTADTESGGVEQLSLFNDNSKNSHLLICPVTTVTSVTEKLDFEQLRNILLDYNNFEIELNKIIEFGFSEENIVKWKNEGLIFEPKNGRVRLL